MQYSIILLLQTCLFSCTQKQSQTERILPDSLSVRDPLVIPEGIAYDSVDNCFYLSSTYLRKIIKIDAGTGTAVDFKHSGEDGITGAVGMRIDPSRRILWSLSSSAGENMPIIDYTPDVDSKSYVFSYNLATGKLIKKYTLQREVETHFLNDLTNRLFGECIYYRF